MHIQVKYINDNLFRSTDLAIIIPWVPVGNSWQLQSIYGVSCCGHWNHCISVAAGQET